MTARDFFHNVRDAIGASDADAERTTRSVLAALSDRLTPDEARKLAAQLPDPLKGIVQKQKSDGVQKMDREIFVSRVCNDLGVDVREAVKRIRGVYAVLEAAVSRGESEHVMAQLPHRLREVMRPPA